MASNEKQFEREGRYFVFKFSDLNKLRDKERNGVCYNLSRVSEIIESDLPDREYLVIESDWPEYEQTWRAIEARVTGAAQPVAVEGMPGRPRIKQKAPLSLGVIHVRGAQLMHDAFTAWLSKAAQGLPERKIADLYRGSSAWAASGWNKCLDAVEPLVAQLQARVHRLKLQNEIMQETFAMQEDVIDTLRTANAELVEGLKILRNHTSVSLNQIEMIDALLASAGGGDAQ